MSGVISRSTVVADVAVPRSRARVICRTATSADDLRAHYRLRAAVFVDEQALFEADDLDRYDEEPGTLHVVGLVGDEPCGAVRLYPIDGAGMEWKGDRLAVAPGYRAHHLGAELVAFAVRTAGVLGGSRMIAHVQLPNVRFFERLGWRAQGPVAPFHDVMHQLMSIGLSVPEAE